MQRFRTRGKTVRHREAAANPDGDDAQIGRNKGETSRQRVRFHQAPPHDSPSLPKRPVSELSTPKPYAEACADEC